MTDLSRSGARSLVERSSREGSRAGDRFPHRPIATEDTGKLARLLIDATLDRFQRGSSERTSGQLSLLDELSTRQTRGSAEAFVSGAEIAWIDEHEQGYPHSSLPPEARQGPHGSPAHVCWKKLAPQAP